MISFRPPAPEWYRRDVLEVAPALLGARLRVRGDAGSVIVRITEVEAYRGSDDPGSHAFRGQTPRNAAMFEAGGVLYVYVAYGMHHCVNVVCGPAGTAAAVLLRAGEVVEGTPLARSRRPAAQREVDLARGPARLAAALAVSRDDDGADIAAENRVSLLVPAEGSDAEPAQLRRGPRVGVAGPGGERRFPWRFWLEGEPSVSSYRAARPGRRRTPSGVGGRSTVRGTAD